MPRLVRRRRRAPGDNADLTTAHRQGRQAKRHAVMIRSDRARTRTIHARRSSAGSIPPNKSDLQDFGVYRESNASGKFLDLFWSRVNSPSGTVDMDFELNQNVCDGTATNCATNGTDSDPACTSLRSGARRPLITYDLANGGTEPRRSRSTAGTGRRRGSGQRQVISGGTHEALGSINFSPIATTDSRRAGSQGPVHLRRGLGLL